MVDLPVHNKNIYKIRKLRRDIFSVIYNISSPNFAILLKMLFSAVMEDFVHFFILPGLKFSQSWEWSIHVQLISNFLFLNYYVHIVRHTRPLTIASASKESKDIATTLVWCDNVCFIMYD